MLNYLHIIFTLLYYIFRCTQNTAMVLSFSSAKSTTVGANTRYYTTFYVFRFVSSSTMVLSCTVDLCIAGGCDMVNIDYVQMSVFVSPALNCFRHWEFTFIGQSPSACPSLRMPVILFVTLLKTFFFKEFHLNFWQLLISAYANVKEKTIFLTLILALYCVKK